MTTQTETDGAGSARRAFPAHPHLRMRLIAAHKASGYWAHIICLSDGAVTLHLRPHEPLPDL